MENACELLMLLIEYIEIDLIKSKWFLNSTSHTENPWNAIELKIVFIEIIIDNHQLQENHRKIKKSYKSLVHWFCLKKKMSLVKESNFKFKIKIKDLSKFENKKRLTYRGTLNPNSVWKTNDW
jgi:hypothetical protein